MSEQLIISVSREYGSGGHEIAQKLAEYYKLPMYDHNLLDTVLLDHTLLRMSRIQLIDLHNTLDLGFFVS